MEGALGAKEATEGLMLIPVGDDIMTGFENSLAWKTGMFTNVPTALPYVKVKKKVAMQSQRMGQDDWQFECPMRPSPKYNHSKVVRCQLGDAFYGHIIQDFVRTCSRHILLVDDSGMGCGEIGVAAVGANIAEGATANGIENGGEDQQRYPRPKKSYLRNQSRAGKR